MSLMGLNISVLLIFVLHSPQLSLQCFKKASTSVFQSNDERDLIRTWIKTAARIEHLFNMFGTQMRHIEKKLIFNRRFDFCILESIEGLLEHACRERQIFIICSALLAR